MFFFTFFFKILLIDCKITRTVFSISVKLMTKVISLTMSSVFKVHQKYKRKRYLQSSSIIKLHTICHIWAGEASQQEHVGPGEGFYLLRLPSQVVVICLLFISELHTNYFFLWLHGMLWNHSSRKRMWLPKFSWWLHCNMQ